MAEGVHGGAGRLEVVVDPDHPPWVVQGQQGEVLRYTLGGRGKHGKENNDDNNYGLKML